MEEQPHTLKFLLLPDSMQKTPIDVLWQDPSAHAVYPRPLLTPVDQLARDEH